MKRDSLRRELDSDPQVSSFREVEGLADLAKQQPIPARDIPGVVALVRAGNPQAADHLRRGLAHLVYEAALKQRSPGEWVGLLFVVLDKAIASLRRPKAVNDIMRKVRADLRRAVKEQSEWQQANRIWQRGRGNRKYPRKGLKRSPADWADDSDLHRSDRHDCRSAYEIAAEREAAQRYAARWYDTWSVALKYCHSRRESEIVGYAADGCDPQEIAKMTHTSRRFVEGVLDSVASRLYAVVARPVCYGAA
jgi:hypothetical protein